MNVAQVAAEIFKREGNEYLFCYPLNPLTESCAAVGIKPIIVRQERIGAHMADCISRQTSGERVGVFCMQSGPGSENAMGGVAQAFSESVPLVVIPGGYSRAESWIRPNFNGARAYEHFTKHTEQITTPEMIVPALRRAFTMARNGRPGPVLLEIPEDIWFQQVPGTLEYDATLTKRYPYAPSPQEIDRAAEVLINAKRPLIYAGQGVHYARAWNELKEFVDLLEAPICTSMEGKSAIPETHPLCLGAGAVSMPRPVFDHVQSADVVFGVGASFTKSAFAIHFPVKDKTYIHNTVDSMDINKQMPTHHALIGDAKLTLAMLTEAVRDRLGGKPRGLAAERAAAIKKAHEAWLAEWMPLLTSDEKPISPYRVILDLMQTVDMDNTIITHDSGSPRDELVPFWRPTRPLGYIGWGKTTQLGYGLGLTMGAKLAHPEALCIHWFGDAAIGMVGMDIETAARERIPILSVMSQNGAMACEIPRMELSSRLFRTTDITGHYARWAASLGAHAEHVTEADQITHALVRAIDATKRGQPAFVEVVTTKHKVYSEFFARPHTV